MKLFLVTGTATGRPEAGRGCDPASPMKIRSNLVLSESQAEVEAKEKKALTDSCPGWHPWVISEEITKEALEGYLKQL